MPPRCQWLPRNLSTPSRLLHSPQSTRRTFTSSSSLYDALHKRKGGDLGSHLPKHIIPQDAIIPEYPYGAASLFKQSNKGLYGGQTIQSGNNVSPDTETKTRRHWKPNILTKALYSVALKKKIKLRIASKVLKTMDREGGLDEYLLKESETRVKELGPTGWALRWTLMQTPEVIARFRAEAAAIGLAQEIIDKQWPERPEYRKQVREARRQRAKAEQRQLEQLGKVQEERQVRQRGLDRRHSRIQASQHKIYHNGLAPNRGVAGRMAAVEAVRISQLMKSIENPTARLRAERAYRRAGAEEIEKAGGSVAWIAKYQARWMFKRAPRQGRSEEARELTEILDEEEAAVAPEAQKEGKDAWGDLIKANKADSRSQANA